MTTCAQLRDALESAEDDFITASNVLGIKLVDWVNAWKTYADEVEAAWLAHGKPGKRPKNPPGF
jgi:hypothetical protein